MFKYVKYLWFKVKSWYLYKKKIKEIRKRDPFIYK
jgi:hypothetical protein